MKRPFGSATSRASSIEHRSAGGLGFGRRPSSSFTIPFELGEGCLSVCDVMRATSWIGRKYLKTLMRCGAGRVSKEGTEVLVRLSADAGTPRSGA